MAYDQKLSSSNPLLISPKFDKLVDFKATIYIILLHTFTLNIRISPGFYVSKISWLSTTFWRDIAMQTKSLIFVLIVAISFICLAMTDSNAEYVCGDTNSDETVNVSDAVYLINYVFVFGSPAPDPLCIGDANFDSDVNVSDAVYLINYVFVFGSPAPDPNCCDICPPTVTDIDGNVYQTVLIGEQCWMMENLKVTHYRNGDPIANVTDAGEWESLNSGAYCNYDFYVGNATVYGRLYNWFASTDSRGIAPEGWHVPSDAEWKQLEMYLGMSQAEADGWGLRGTDEGGKLKETGTTHWNPPNTGATNESGFYALPGGYRFYDGSFYAMGEFAFFWSTTEYLGNYVWIRSLGYIGSQVSRSGDSEMQSGHSVRCVKDQ
jgi:uncharacterized protein (TIGR02145 family)